MRDRSRRYDIDQLGKFNKAPVESTLGSPLSRTPNTPTNYTPSSLGFSTDTSPKSQRPLTVQTGVPIFTRPFDASPLSYDNRTLPSMDYRGASHEPMTAGSSVYGSYDDNASLASHSNRGSYDKNAAEDDFHMEETGMKQLHISDRTSPEAYSPVSKTGQKRRASSPAQKERLPMIGGVSSPNDEYRRASGPNPALFSSSRLHPHHGSVSSTSSMRQNSWASSARASVSTNLTAFSTYDAFSSPGGRSPMSEGQHSPLRMSISLDPSPRGSIADHHRAASDSTISLSGRKTPVDHSASRSSPTGGFICQCCVKKPRKFDTLEALQ
jgi:hypothetical protein